MAIELGISKGTIDKYLQDAVTLLGATSRRHAAEMLTLAEARAPSGIGGDFTGLESPRADDAPVAPQLDEGRAPEGTQSVLRDMAYGGRPEFWYPTRDDRLLNLERLAALSPMTRIGMVLGLLALTVLALGVFIVAVRGLGVIFWETSL